MARLVNEGALEGMIQGIGNDILDIIHLNSFELGKTICVPALQSAVKERVYDAYTPKYYKRTWSLYKSIEPFADLKQNYTRNGFQTSTAKRSKKSVKFGAFFDQAYLEHYSYFTSKNRGREDAYDVPDWSNDGWSWQVGKPRKTKTDPAPDYLKYGVNKIARNPMVTHLIKRLVEENLEL